MSDSSPACGLSRMRKSRSNWRLTRSRLGLVFLRAVWPATQFHFLMQSGARRHPEAKWLLAVAYSRAGESEKAARLFDAVPMWAGEAGAAYRRIVQAGDGSEIWKSAFASTWGVDPDLFLATRTVRYRAADLHSLEGPVKSGSVRRFDPVRDKPGFLLFGPYDYYPRGAYRAVFRLQTTKASGSAREADNPVLRLDVYNGRVLVQREVSAEESGDRNAFHLISSTTAQTARWSSV